MNFKINLIWIKNSFKLLVMNYYELILINFNDFKNWKNLNIQFFNRKF